MDHRRRLMRIRRNIQLELDMLNITNKLNHINERSTLGSTGDDQYSTSGYINGYGITKLSCTTQDYKRSLSSSTKSFSMLVPSAKASLNQSNIFHAYDRKGYNSNRIPIGRYNNWNIFHAQLANKVWCCLGNLLAFCHKYECKIIRATDIQTHNTIVSEVRALLSGATPFGITRRFPNNIRGTLDNMWICIGRSPIIEYQLGRIQSIFRKPLTALNADKQRMARENFHLSIKAILRDAPSSITDARAYDRDIFEKEFHLKWSND